MREFANVYYTSNLLVYDKVIKLLDRQAAITERHWMEISGASANAAVELNKQRADLQAKRDELTAERDYYKEQFARCLAHAVNQERGANFDKLIAYPTPDGFIEPWQLVTDEINCLRDFYAEAAAERDRLREALDDWQAGTFYAKLCEARDERDRLQRVVRIQAESFKALEREIAVLRRSAQSDGQTHRAVAGKPSDGLKTGDLRDAAYRHERLLIAIWRWLDIKRLRGEPVTPEDVDMWREKIEREGIKPE